MGHLALATLLFAGVQDVRKEAEVRAELEHIKVSYEANRAAFPHGTFRFDYLRGSADNESDAHSGRLRPTPVRKGFYAFDGSNARYEIVYEPIELENAIVRTVENKGSSKLAAFRLLSDGRATLFDLISPDEKQHILQHDARITQKTIYQSFFEFPVGLGNPVNERTGIGLLIKRYLNGEIEVQSYEPHKSFEGRDVALIVFKMEGGSRWFWIDLGRGSLPIESRTIVKEERKSQVTSWTTCVSRTAPAGFLTS